MENILAKIGKKKVPMLRKTSKNFCMEEKQTKSEVAYKKN